MQGSRRAMIRTGWLPLLAALLLATAGCSAISTDKKEDSSPPAQTDKTSPVYLDFDDVLIPGEMEIDRGESFVYQTTGFTVGSLTLKGRVELGSLIVFFEKNMPRDNWRMVSQFKSPQRTMMLYHKQNRWCVVEISEGSYNTYTKLWVSPTMQQTSGGLVK